MMNCDLGRDWLITRTPMRLFYAVDGTIHQIDHATIFESVELE